MTEIITASILEKPTSLDKRGREFAPEVIEKLKQTVLDFLKANEINPDTALFTGYDANTPARISEEHITEDGIPISFLGNTLSLTAPELLGRDEEEVSEHWIVNPLRYALEGGTLGIYDREMLDAITGGPHDFDVIDVEEFGTYTYAIHPEVLDQAKLAELLL